MSKKVYPIKAVLNIPIEDLKIIDEIAKKRNISRNDLISESINDELREYEWKKKHTTELGILKEIYELRKNTDLFTDNLEELKPKLIKSGKLLNRLKQCNLQFFEDFCAFISMTKDKLDFENIDFRRMNSDEANKIEGICKGL